MRRKFRYIMLAAVIPMVLALIPATADAQRVRGGGRMVRPGHGVVIRGHVGGYWGGYWGAPYWGGFWWDPLWVGPYWGFPYYRYWERGYYDDSAELRLEVKPKDAQVYVDGYYAGIVDDFNGIFQRLHIRPGNHELALYLPGFRTVTQNLHLGVGQDSKIKLDMTPLAAGESNPPPPQPTAPPSVQEGYGDQPGAPNTAVRPQRPMPRRPARPAPAAPAPAPPPGNEAGQEQGYGSLVIRVQPAGADIVIDGERWQGPEGSERLVVQVAEGSHRIEVRKDGYSPFSTTVQVRGGETAPVNVSLPPIR
jgi:PEGA domain